MKETYKEVLAKKYAVESNYTIIIPTDTLEELEALWNKFTSTMTIRQQRLCDDRSIQIYGLTNQQHYEKLKAEFENQTTGKRIETNSLPQFSFSKEPKFKKASPEIRHDEDKSDEEKLIASFTVDKDKDFEGLVLEDFSPADDDAYEEKREIAKDYELASNLHIIKEPELNPDIDAMKADLEKQHDAFNTLTPKQKLRSDEECIRIYGMTNEELYNKTKETLDNPEKLIESICSDPETFVGQHCIEHLNETSEINEETKTKSRFNDTPYFTPTELIDMGVHNNDNYYSVKADNNELVNNVSVTTWFDSYKDMISQRVFEDYTIEWIQTLDKLYSDFDTIKECGTESEILARKQSILDLGWNPEIPFTPENRVKAAKRINGYVDEYMPKDIFIDLDIMVPDEFENEIECPQEAVSESTHKPIFIMLTKGKTPFISDSIKKVTKSEYSHASISFDADMKEIASYNFREESHGLVMESLEKLKDIPVTIWVFFAENEIVERCKRRLYDFKTHKTTYDFRMLPRFIIKRDKRPSKNEYKQICSTFVDNILKAGDIDLSNGLNMPSPADIYEGIKTKANVIFQVYDGPANKYNSRKVKRQLDRLEKDDNTQAINEAINDIKNGVNPFGHKTFYHLSFDPDLDEKTLTPRVPEWITGMKEKDKDFEKKLEKFKTEVNPDGYGYEDPKTPRICFSNSIEGALNAIINPNKRLHLAGKQIYVFVPEKPISEYKTRSNKVIKKNGDIFDANITNEMWILEPCKVKFIGSIVVDKVEAKRRKKFTNNKEMNVMEYSYKWRWFHKISKKEKFHESTIVNEGIMLKIKKAILPGPLNAKYYQLPSSFVELYDKYAGVYGSRSSAIEMVFSPRTLIPLDKEPNTPYIFLYHVQYPGNVNVTVYDNIDHYINKYLSQSKKKHPGMSEKDIKEMTYTNYILTVNKFFGGNNAVNNNKIEILSPIINIDGGHHKILYSNLKESVSIFNEVKKFPVEFDKDGNLIIYKCSTNNIDFDAEIDDSVTLLETYRNTNNQEGMKYELSKIWYLISELEKRMKKRNVKTEEYNKLVKQRSICMNIFKQNFTFLTQLDKDFNFAAYYNSTPFSNNGVKITNNTLRYSIETMKRILK